jgi:3-phenylpropionate/trans-cinnamate dioxygenase ferredoxin reductase subunit
VQAMVIIGAGQTGGRTAQALRAEGWKGPIVLVGVEDDAPYERPPLSKTVLRGEKTIGECALFEPPFLTDSDIDFRSGAGVTEIRPERHEVVLSDGAVLRYHRLLLATGAEPKTLNVPGSHRDGVGYLRTAADSLRLAARLGRGRRLVIIGGGFIGLEVAASAAALGTNVTVVEVASRLLLRAVPAEIEPYVAARHHRAGIDIRLASQVATIDGDDRVRAVTLADGSVVPCDTVLIAVGVLPRAELARSAGLAIDNGIAVDRRLRTSDPDIFAAGDACSFPHDLFDGRIRLESWKNAEDQGRLVARNMLGGGECYSAVPWLWSDQYETTIQVAGMPGQASRSITRPLAPDALLVFHLAADGRIVGASGFGPNGSIGRGVRLGQMMIERRSYPDPEMLADPAINLKLLLRAEAA